MFIWVYSKTCCLKLLLLLLSIELLGQALIPHSPDRIVNGYQPDMEFFIGEGRKSHRVSSLSNISHLTLSFALPAQSLCLTRHFNVKYFHFFQIDHQTLARWGCDANDGIEYIYNIRQNGNEKPSRLRISIYDSHGVKKELTNFISDVVKNGGHYSPPDKPFMLLPRFKGRNLFLSPDVAKKKCASEPDFKIGGVHGLYVADEEKRQYRVWLMNPCSERSASRFNNWYGSALMYSVPSACELTDYIDTSIIEIKEVRAA